MSTAFSAFNNVFNFLPLMVLVGVAGTIIALVGGLASSSTLEPNQKSTLKPKKTGIRGLDMYEGTRQRYVQQERKVRKYR